MDDRYRIYRTNDWPWRYQVVQGSKYPGEIYVPRDIAITLRGAKRIAARWIRNDQRPQEGPVWVQPLEAKP